jgi:hypothetical protein
MHKKILSLGQAFKTQQYLSVVHHDQAGQLGNVVTAPNVGPFFSINRYDLELCALLNRRELLLLQPARSTELRPKVQNNGLSSVKGNHFVEILELLER